MRWYDANLTPITGKTCLEDNGETTYPETDERVANWFTSSTFEIDGVMTEHTRSFDDNGFPILTAIIPPTQTELDAIEAQRAIDEDNNDVKTELKLLDMASIRDMREFIAKQPNAPAELKKLEAQAVAARGRIV